MEYCDRCGGNLKIVKKDEVWFCATCNRHIYNNPIPTVDAILLDEDDRMLLGVRAIEPGLGMLNLPGGFVDMNETFEEAVVRELYEELKLTKNDYSRLKIISSRVDYHTQENVTRQLLIVLVSGRIKHEEFLPSDEVSKYVWKRADEIKPEEISKNEYRHIQEVWKILKTKK